MNENIIIKQTFDNNETITDTTILNKTCINDDTIIKDTIVKDTIVKDNIIKDNIVNDTIVKDTIVNDTIVNDTIVNDTIINNTISNYTNSNKQNIYQINNNNRLLGRVKWFSSRLGYGFVTCIIDNNQMDYFIHWKNILYNNDNIYIFLFKNELVEFELKDYGFGIQCFNLTGPRKSLILLCSLGKSSKYLHNIHKYAKNYKVRQLDISELKFIDNLSENTINLFKN